MEGPTPQEKNTYKEQQNPNLNMQMERRDDGVSQMNGELNMQSPSSWRMFVKCVMDNPSIRFFVKGFKYLKRNGVYATLQKIKAKGGIISILQKLFHKNDTVSTKPLKNADELSFTGMVNCACSNGADVFLADELKGYELEKKRKILLVSHELDLTGAPIVLLNYALSLLRNGDLPVIACPNAGKLTNSVVGNGIPVIVFDGIYSTEFVRRFALLFDVIIVNTIVGTPVVNMLANTETPVLWWIHEAEASYKETILAQLPTVQPQNVSIYCVGAYAEKVLLSHRPSFQTKQMLYHTVDMERSPLLKCPIEKDNRLLFAMVGSMQERKGPDILSDAILILPEETIAQSRFLFVGYPEDSVMVRKVKTACKRYPDNVKYLGEMSHDQVLALYQNVDCLIAPSRDDPMPCTITEVLLLSVPVICSENCGYAPLITKMECGKVFADNDSQKLAAEITNFVNNRTQLHEMRVQARRTYETYFSESVFDYNSQMAIADTIKQGVESRRKSVSVVIPTYNAGEEGLKLFQLLRGQEGLDELEIIVVDSGSKDNTVEIARQYCNKVIQIPNEAFSHSYARNLGAQSATANYILFMTQDAVPSSANWINKMVSSIQEHGAVAVSCREIPKQDCDLYGVLCGLIHNQYMGIMDHDRILRKPAVWNAENIRKNAQLNDVACIVLRDVFLHYKFRGNYAEDLDLGLRLISDNYRLMLLSSAPVIHSHTRSAMYHFRRAIVDEIALKRIIPEISVAAITTAQAYNRMLTCALMSFYGVNAMQKHFSETISLRKLSAILNDIFSEAEVVAKGISKAAILESVRKGIPCDDGGMLQLTEEILGASQNISFDLIDFYDIKSFILNEVIGYFERTNPQISPTDVQNIADTMIKRLGSTMGSILAEYDMTEKNKDKSLVDLIQKYSLGI